MEITKFKASKEQVFFQSMVGPFFKLEARASQEYSQSTQWDKLEEFKSLSRTFHVKKDACKSNKLFATKLFKV